ncbi:MAG: hypothetical protein IJT85_04965 [Ruminococcus sp.]|nr:hypothetical protein [Ruminococcus sp.]MBQ7744902.1 hypothetical protein [Ruminococcus sp.]MDO4883009.1 hypothetical protein [Oscillospiraceae bacterium]
MSENINNLLSQLSKKLGVSSNEITSAAQKGDVQSLLKNADSEEAKQFNAVLSDPEKTKQVLNSPQAKAIMKLLSDK